MIITTIEIMILKNLTKDKTFNKNIIQCHINQFKKGKNNFIRAILDFKLSRHKEN